MSEPSREAIDAARMVDLHEHPGRRLEAQLRAAYPLICRDVAREIAEALKAAEPVARYQDDYSVVAGYRRAVEVVERFGAGEDLSGVWRDYIDPEDREEGDPC